MAEFYNKLATRSEHAQKHDGAPSTVKTISSQWGAFRECYREANVLTLITDESECCFLANGSTFTGRVHSKGSLAQYVGAVKTVHKMLRPSIVSTLSEYGSLGVVLKGFRKWPSTQP